jgi:hypothetical protein
MKHSDAISAIAIEEGRDYFVYYGREGEIVPEDVTHVRIDSSVRAIEKKAFYGRRKLIIVLFNDDLEEIGVEAFALCTLLHEIVIPNAVKTIRCAAFYFCSGLTNVTLGEGLEEIGVAAFAYCTLLHEIVIPNAVKTIHFLAFCECTGLTNVTLGEGLEVIGAYALSLCDSLECIVIPNAVKTIKDQAFHNCRGLTTVILGNGLVEIWEEAFSWCITLERIVIPNAVKTIRSRAFYKCRALKTVTLGKELEVIGSRAFSSCVRLERIVIPNAVKSIHETAFKNCPNLTSVKFERFVTFEAMQDWWKQGVGVRSLRTYCFLVRCNIPARYLSLARVSSWQVNIADMLRIIRTICAKNMHVYFASQAHRDWDEWGKITAVNMNAYFDTIDAKLSVYENLLNEAHVLFPERFGLNDGVTTEILSYL